MKTPRPGLIIPGVGLLVALASWPIVLRWARQESQPDL